MSDYIAERQFLASLGYIFRQQGEGTFSWGYAREIEGEWNWANSEHGACVGALVDFLMGELGRKYREVWQVIEETPFAYRHWSNEESSAINEAIHWLDLLEKKSQEANPK